MLALLLQGDWEAAHGPPSFWYTLLGTWGPLLIGALLLVLLARSLLHARRYRALGVLSEADLALVHAALRDAERRTVGEIVPVVVERSDPHPAADWLAALSFVLVLTALLAPWLPWDHPFLLLSCQIAFGAAGYGAARWLPAFKRLFVLEGRARAVSEEQAFQEFHAQGLHRTEAATGVLVFVSLRERRVVVLADEGIAARVEPGVWEQVDDDVLAGVARGSLRDGLIAAVRRTGDVLAAHAPWTEGDRNELPDRLIVRRE